VSSVVILPPSSVGCGFATLGNPWSKHPAEQSPPKPAPPTSGATQETRTFSFPQKQGTKPGDGRQGGGGWGTPLKKRSTARAALSELQVRGEINRKALGGA